MSFIAHKNANRRPKVVNRSSFLFRLKNAFTRKKVVRHTLRTNQTQPAQNKPETNKLKRKFGLIKRINPRVLHILIASLSFVVFALIILGIISLMQSPMFALKEIKVIGNNSVSEDQIKSEINRFIGKSLFLINSSEVEDEVKKEYINLVSVNVEKVYPDKLFIKITEKEPRLILVNLNGAYLIDEDGVVINVLAQEKINYSQDRLDLLAGFADENSPLIRAIFVDKFIAGRNIATVSKEEQDKIIALEFNFDAIPVAQKTAEYKNLKNEIQNELDALTGETLRKLELAKYSYLPEIILLNNQMYKVNDSVDQKRLNLTLELIRYFANPQSGPTVVGHIFWNGQMLVEVNLSDNTKIIFGVLKKPSYQLEDYEIITNYLVSSQKKYSQIDLSSTKISVK